MSNKDSVIIGKNRANKRLLNQERRKVYNKDLKDYVQKARGKYSRYSEARDTRDNRYHFGNCMPIKAISN